MASEDNEDVSEAKSDDLSHGGLAEVYFEQNMPQQFGTMSESSSNTIHYMELDVKEYTEQAFTEARERVEKIAKASSDKTSTQSKLRVERGEVERVTAVA
ncbi:hypothetical protein Tco_1492342 [Tanacetum coccineum]